MRTEKLLQIRTIHESNPVSFEKEMNSFLTGIKADDIKNIIHLEPLKATVYYFIEVSESETIEDLYYEKFGKYLRCGACEYFQKSNDKRTKKGLCKYHNIVKREDSSGCDEAMREEMNF